MEVDLQSLLYLGSMSRDVHSCTHWLRPRNPLPSPRIAWTHIREGAMPICNPLRVVYCVRVDVN